jgi:hypothetical protein
MHKDENRPPCKHMKPMLNKAADGSLKGFAKWYTLAHAARCSGCGRFLRNLEQLILNMRKSRESETDSEALARLAKVVKDPAGVGEDKSGSEEARK